MRCFANLDYIVSYWFMAYRVIHTRHGQVKRFGVALCLLDLPGRYQKEVEVGRREAYSALVQDVQGSWRWQRRETRKVNL